MKFKTCENVNKYGQTDENTHFHCAGKLKKYILCSIIYLLITFILKI